MASRKLLTVVSLLAFSVALSAAELKITVRDPNSHPVAGARVTLYRPASAQPIAAATTNASGDANFEQLSSETYSLHVAAPGFSPLERSVKLSESSVINLQLSISAPSETVVVTAAGSPAPLEETGAAESVLDSATITNTQPVSVGEALRLLPGAVVSTAGQRGGITSLFVRGGDSRYNKVIVDGVPVNDPGGTFDFGVVPMQSVDRLEFVRGPESTLYGSDAMTSVVQLWTASGHTPLPELTFGADGGNYSTAHGFATLAGARGRFDYDLFGDQFNTQGQSVNDDYSNSLAGMNVGYTFTPQLSARLRLRHANSRSGVPGEWNFNGIPFLRPDIDQFTRDNDFLSSGEITYAPSPRWQHRFTGFEYNERRMNQDQISDRDCFNFGIDCPFLDVDRFNRAGFQYQGEFIPLSWAHTIFGYEFEDENGSLRENFTGLTADPGDATHGLRRNHALYGEQFLNWKRFSFLGGLRYVHNESFGDKAVPHVALTYLLLRGGSLFSGTRLRLVYGAGIKEPRFEETFGLGRFTLPNPKLKAEENRSLEAGFEQNFFSGRYSLSAGYFNNIFRNQIEFETVNPVTFAGQYFNLNRSLAHGAEVELRGRISERVSLLSSYVYTATQILSAPQCATSFCDPTVQPGAPLLRRPRHAGSLLFTYSGTRWGGTLGGSFIGRRPDSDFLFCNLLGCSVPAQNHTAGYARLDLGGWRQLNHYVTAYADLDNALNKHYEDVAGFPAPRINFRAGLRFRVGAE